jgi:hypothetical protein
MNVINTGNLETATDGTVFEQIAIKDENEAMMHGSQVPVLAYDQHYEHITGHRSLIADPSMRQDAELVKIVTEHINEHINQLMTVNPNTLMAMGMQPIQAAPPAPAEPAGANPAAEPVPTAMPPVEQAVDQTGAQPQEVGARMPAGFEEAPLSAEENLARMQGE